MRTAIVAIGFAAALALALSSCPSNRDGAPGQFAAARQTVASAARSGAFALDLWAHHRNTRALTAVQLADARDEVVQSYGNTAVLDVSDPADVSRQRLLSRTMTEVVELLDSAGNTVRNPSGNSDLDAIGRRLAAAADSLDREYR